jgi:hypothetical protein
MYYRATTRPQISPARGANAAATAAYQHDDTAGASSAISYAVAAGPTITTEI